MIQARARRPTLADQLHRTRIALRAHQYRRTRIEGWWKEEEERATAAVPAESAAPACNRSEAGTRGG